MRSRKSQTTEIRKRFREYFGIAGDPFYEYSKENGWRPRFRIASEDLLAGGEYPYKDENDAAGALLRKHDK